MAASLVLFNFLHKDFTIFKMLLLAQEITSLLSKTFARSTKPVRVHGTTGRKKVNAVFQRSFNALFPNLHFHLTECLVTEGISANT